MERQTVIHLDPKISEEEARHEFEKLGEISSMGFFGGNWTAIILAKVD